MDPVRDELQKVVERVEGSALSDNQKDQVYVLVTRILEARVLPAFLKRLPKEKAEELAKNPDQLTVESYADLLKSAVGDPEYYREVEETVKTAIAEIDTALKEEGI